MSIKPYVLGLGSIYQKRQPLKKEIAVFSEVAGGFEPPYTVLQTVA